MIGRGMFFLTRKPGLVQLQGHDGQLVEAWAFSLLERTRRGQQRVLAYWPRADADAFVMAHHAQLESGQALNFELERVKPSGDGLLGFVLSCALAPDRWPAHPPPIPPIAPAGRNYHLHSMTHMITAGGREYHLTGAASLAPGGRPVHIEDIAHHLSQINRFTGAARRPYSVAEHSLFVSEIAQRSGATLRVQLAGLLHDAHEAYTQDVSSPAKRAINFAATQSGGTKAWTQFEEDHARTVHTHFNMHGIFRGSRAALHVMDLQALATERRDLTAFNADVHLPWEVLGDELRDPDRFVPAIEWMDLDTPEREAMSWKDWRQAFMDRYAEITFGLSMAYARGDAA